jgi:hypothetical protein
MRLGNPLLGLPRLVRIATFPAAEGEKATQRSIQEILAQIKRSYGAPCSELDQGLMFSQGSLETYVEGIQEEDSQTFLLALRSTEDGDPSTKALEEPATDNAQLDRLMELLPRPALSVLDLRVARASSLEQANKTLDEYLTRVNRRARSMGIIDGCLLAGLDDEAGAFSEPLRREFVLLPFDPTSGQPTLGVWELCGEMATLAAYAGRLSRLRARHDLALRQIDASEQSTQMRINEILAGLRLPLEQIQSGSLEGILTEVTTLFSRLSILAGAMRRDYVRAQALVRGVGGLLMMWQEEPLHSYPKNSLVEAEAYESLIAPFKDYIDRVEAMRTQLNTVLEAVRTYLEIQGQRTSVEEQKSSKQQLIRLVNLQEMVGKLEILIVAVYLTEMARIAFEAIAHEQANILTAAFIPMALALAVLISRLLHRKG